MSHDQPFIWKISLGGPISWVGQSLLGISKVGQTALAKLMESHIWHQLTGSVGGEFSKETMVSDRPDVRHFISSPYAIGAF